MSWIEVLTAVLAPTVSGYIAVSAFSGGSAGFTKKLVLGFGAGLGLVSLGLFLVGVLGVPFSFAAAAAALAVLTLPFLAAGYFLKDRREYAGGGASRPLFTLSGRYRDLKAAVLVLMLIVLAFKLFFVMYEGFGRPMVSQDAWWNWSSGAKFFYFTKGLLLDPADEHFFGRGYRVFQSYPLLNPLVQVWYALVYGSFHESLVKAWSPLLFIGILALLYMTIKKEAGRVAAVILTFALSGAPLITYHSIEAYSDLPLAFFVLGGSVLLWEYMEEGTARSAALSGLFFAMAAFTKSEGLIYLLAAIAAISAHTVFERNGALRGVLYFTVPAVLYILPWVAFKSWYGIGFGHGYGTGVGTVAETSGIPWSGEFHVEVIWIFLKELFFTVNHALIFPFLAVLTAINLRTALRGSVKYLFFVMLLTIAAFLLIYTMTFDYKYILNRTAANRNIMTFLPLAFFLAGLVAARSLGKDDG